MQAGTCFAHRLLFLGTAVQTIDHRPPADARLGRYHQCVGGIRRVDAHVVDGDHPGRLVQRLRRGFGKPRLPPHAISERETVRHRTGRPAARASNLVTAAGRHHLQIRALPIGAALMPSRMPAPGVREPVPRHVGEIAARMGEDPRRLLQSSPTGRPVRLPRARSAGRTGSGVRTRRGSAFPRPIVQQSAPRAARPSRKPRGGNGASGHVPVLDARRRW